MSRLWSDTVVLTLMPDRLVLLRTRRRLMRKVMDKDVRLCSGHCTPDDWSELIELCRSALSESRWRVGRVRVLVSNHLVRYACVPWVRGLENVAEEEALVRRRLDDIYGATVISAAQLRWDQSGPQRLAVALPNEPLERLRELCQVQGHRLVSVQPLLMAVFNRFRNVVKPFSGAWFAVAEDGLLCLGAVGKRGWRSLRCVRTDNAELEMAAILTRERLISGAADEPDERVYVLSATTWPADSHDRLCVLPLVCSAMPGFDPVRDSQFTLAVLGSGL